MKSKEALEAAWQAEDRPQTGVIQLLVLRKGGGVHETPPRVELCPERGILGDRWSQGETPEIEAQVTLMSATAARLIADGQPLHLPGDNVLVDLDLDEALLPAGTRLRLGSEAVVEVSALPHTGCGRFAERFGADALKWVNAKPNRARRLRGVNCRVIEGGVVSLGDTVDRF